MVLRQQHLWLWRKMYNNLTKYGRLDVHLLLSIKCTLYGQAIFCDTIQLVALFASRHEWIQIYYSEMLNQGDVIVIHLLISTPIWVACSQETKFDISKLRLNYSQTLGEIKKRKSKKPAALTFALRHIHATANAPEYKTRWRVWVHACFCLCCWKESMWARTFAAVVTSRGQRESLQFLLSLSSLMTRPQQRAWTNIAIRFPVVSFFPARSLLYFGNFNGCYAHCREMLNVCMLNVRLHKWSSSSPCVVFVKSVFLSFLWPCVPRTSIPVRLGLKGQLEGWQPSLTSEGWESTGRSAMAEDESKNCRWGRAGRE